MDRAQYDGEFEAGLITEEDRIELLAGKIVDVSPEGPPHRASIQHLLSTLIRRLDPQAWVVLPPGPVALSDLDQPEPDLCVARARADDYYTSHPDPSDLVLVIEVAHSSQRRDRVLKAERYALAGIEDYWVVDLVEACTVVHRDPVDGVYQSVEVVPGGAAVRPLTFPDLALQPHLRVPGT